MQKSCKEGSLQASNCDTASFKPICFVLFSADHAPTMFYFRSHKQQDHAVFHSSNGGLEALLLVILRAMFTAHDDWNA